MELWFWLALGSAIAGGIGSFTHKVAAERHYDAVTISAYSSLISSFIVLGFLLYNSNFSFFWSLATVFALIGSITYLLVLVLKIEALKSIDSALFFPLYKVFGPLITIIFGIIFFGESFTAWEWFGLVLSITVPILLITRTENKRQKNLKRGVYIVLASSVIGAISVAAYKYSIDISKNVWLLIYISEVFLVATALTILVQKYQRTTLDHLKAACQYPMVTLAGVMGLTQALGAVTMSLAFFAGGTLGIVYTINSLYILIPIILSIIFYNEHWNARKVIAIALSIVALAFLG